MTTSHDDLLARIRRHGRNGRAPVSVFLVTLIGISLLAVGCGGGAAETTAAGEGSGDEVTLIAYAVPEPAFAELIPAFQATPSGEGVEFIQSYGASGDQSRAVANGLPASVVNLSVEPDIERIVEAGLIAEDWSAGEYGGVPADSLVVLAVRPGNPKGITGWEDLLRDDVEIVTADFQTSGSAKWNALAAWGAAKERGADDAGATEFLTAMYANVVAQEKSGRDATNAFSSGRGDVLLTYENEAIAAQRNGIELEYIVPQETMLIEAPVAVLEGAPEAATAFVDFLYTPEAQRLWAEAGFRPVDESILAEYASDLPAAGVIFDIGLFGGWEAANAEFFDEDTGIAVKAARG